ncbi:hypothetical protein EZS27_026747, partial [termite gut metagenome]
CLLSVKLLGVSPVNTVYRDSIYRHIIKDGFYQLNCYLSYPQGSSQVLKTYDNNSYELNKLDEFIQFVLTEPSVYVNKISITGYCSIEGTYSYNQQLSKDRVSGFINFVNREYNLSELYPVEFKWEGEDWNTLRRLLTGSTIPERYEVIQIIDEVRNPDEREMRLRVFNGGRPYKKIFDELFPLLRRVNIKVEYNARQILKDNPTNGELGEAIDSILQQKDKQPLVNSKSPREAKWWYPVSLRTNVISWVGFTPDLKHRTFTPNLAAEFYLEDRWSIIASITYSYLNFTKNKQFWGVSGYSIEPRYQLTTSFSNNDPQRLYIGGYVQYGDFDYCLDIKSTKRTNNYTGIYAQAGLSLGYHFQITPVWGIELGLRGGYQYSKTKTYEIEAPQNYLKNKLTENKIKIDGLNLNVTYKFK